MPRLKQRGKRRRDEARLIRLATKADRDTICRLVDAAYRHYIPRIGKPPGPMLDDYARRIEEGQTWVLEDAGEIVGILVLEQGPAGFLLDNIAVLPDRQGNGFGRALIEFAEAEAGRRGFDEIHLYTHAMMSENIALYRRLGFVVTHQVNEKGYARFYMAKRLESRGRTKS
jgi:ribosomal protein S18 acetylase RimI-like enzyme